MKAPRIQRDLISGFLLAALSVALWMYTDSFPELDDGYPGPALVPRIIAVSLGLAGLFLLVNALRTRTAHLPYRERISKAGLFRLVAGLVVVSSYPLLAGRVHFVPIMAGLILLFGLLLKIKPWVTLLTAVLSAGLMYALFTQLLGVPL